MIETIIEENHTHKEILATWIIIDNISRPKSSVPSQYSDEGGCRRSDMTCSLIPSFVKKEANIASKIKNNTIINPTRAILFRLNSFHASRHGLTEFISSSSKIGRA